MKLEGVFDTLDEGLEAAIRYASACIDNLRSKKDANVTMLHWVSEDLERFSREKKGRIAVMAIDTMCGIMREFHLKNITAEKAAEFLTLQKRILDEVKDEK